MIFGAKISAIKKRKTKRISVEKKKLNIQKILGTKLLQ